MKKNITALVILVFASSLSTFSQDIIYKTDGSKEEARVILVGDREIQYKKFNNPDGPVYVIKRGDILLITYEKGGYDVLNQSTDQEASAKPDLSADFSKNILSYHLFDLIFGDFGISYERLLPSGKVGFKIPVAFGFDEYDNWDFNNIFYSGLGVNFYPTGQGKWRYFMGPQLRIGYSKATDWVSYFDDQGNYLYDEEVDSEGMYTKFFVDNGIQFMPLKNFSVSAVASIGIRYFPEAPYEEDVVRTDGQFAINLSYRF